MVTVVVRPPTDALAKCELTHMGRQDLDVERAKAQHRGYTALLQKLGAELIELTPQPTLPDAVFVEDPAVVLDEVAIITRPGAVSRQPESASVAEALRPYRRLLEIEEPGTLEGGDVLVIGDRAYVGLSSRTNDLGIRQLERYLAPYGYRVKPVDVSGCLHLKTACTYLGQDSVIVNPGWIQAEAIEVSHHIEVDPAEPFAGNVLRVGEALVAPQSCPASVQRLRERGFEVHTVDISEFMKAEAGLTCMSLRFTVQTV